jgi:DAK2 domain fusion protein YloV
MLTEHEYQDVLASRPPQPPLYELDGTELRKLFGAGAAWLEYNAPLVNSLNVFPVPDGDTGTNMLLTMQAAMHQTNAHPSLGVGAVSKNLAEGALLGARGNSGVILSQILAGIARSVEARETIDARLFAAALMEGSRTAYSGVVKPVEGTILTVIRQAAERAVAAAEESDDIRLVMEQVHQAARGAVLQTPDLLPVLREAGVVDAGAQGLAFVFEGASKHLDGKVLEGGHTAGAAQNLPRLAVADGFGYDIQFHIRGTKLNVAEIREKISMLGDSALIVGDESLVKVHVHALNPGEIIKYGAEKGPLINIIIENMQAQYLDFMAGNTADVRVGAENLGAILPHEPPNAAASTEDLRRIAIIAVAPGDGFRDLFKSLQVAAVVKGGPTMNPSTQDLLQAINQVNAQEVILLPNDKNILLAASQVQQLTDKVIQVVPSQTLPQGLAALLPFNPQSDLESNVRNMSAALLHIRTIELTHAVRSARINEIAVQEGKPIALVDGELIAAGEDIRIIILDVLHRTGASENEIITLYYGSKVSAAEAQAIYASVQHEFPYQKVELYSGGQPLYPFIISVE